jgi:hypothetical protein
MIGLGTFVIAAAMVSPSFAGKKAVSDDELDLVTAAGQPVIVQIGGDGTVSFVPTTRIAQIFQTSSQNNLRALVLNNVAGENQVANGINISTTSATATGVAQNNTITQSWGSTSDITVSSVGALFSSITVTCGDALICKVNTQTVLVPGVGARRLSQAADIIIHVGGAGTVTYSPSLQIEQVIEGGSQTGLVALVVNNVAGLNQVGNGVNISAGSLSLGSNISATGNASVTGPAAQINNLSGYRGTPANFSRSLFP